MFFRGRFDHAIDGKGRTSVPARFRDVLVQSFDEKLVVTFGFPEESKPFLSVFPLKNWEEIAAGLTKLNQSDPAVRYINRRFVAHAQDVEVDKLGRVLLPQNLRDYAALEKDVVWVGLGKRIQLWSQANWTAVNSAGGSADVQTQADHLLGGLG